MLLSFDMGTHAGAEFNIHTRLDPFTFGLGVALSYVSDGFISSQINELTGANGLGNVMATVVILLNVGGYVLMDGSIRGTVGVDPPDQAQSDNEPTAVQSVDRNDSKR